MPTVRSIDRSDLGGATVTLTTTAETVALVGPLLQTPKDTSFVIALASYQLTSGTGTTGVTARIRAGSTTSGALIGQAYVKGNVTASAGDAGTLVATTQVANTDFVQWCLTLQQTAATGNGTVNAATIAMMSF